MCERDVNNNLSNDRPGTAEMVAKRSGEDQETSRGEDVRAGVIGVSTEFKRSLRTLSNGLATLLSRDANVAMADREESRQMLSRVEYLQDGALEHRSAQRPRGTFRYIQHYSQRFGTTGR